MAYYIWFILSLLSYLINVTGQSHDCISHPVSFSNITNCVDKVCYSSGIVSFTQVFDGITETCVDFQTPNNTVASTLHVIGSKTAATYPLKDCYFTDDPALNFTFTCSCLKSLCNLGVASLFCQSFYDSGNCPLYNTTTPSVFDSGTQSNSDCIAGLVGNWCSRLLLTAFPRYKICQLDDPTYSVLFNVHNDNGNILIDGVYSGLIKDFNSTFVNLTLSNSLGGAQHKGKFILWDKQDMSNYYLLPPSTVNDINSFDTNKVGWLKVINGQVIHQLKADDFDIAIKSCRSNVGSLRHDLMNIASFLTSHREFLGSLIFTDRVLFDDEYTVPLSDEGLIPQHYLFPYKYIVDGVPFYDPSGEVKFLGVQKDYNYNTYNITFKPDITLNIIGAINPFPFSDGQNYVTFTVYCLYMDFVAINATANHDPILCIALTPKATAYNFGFCSQYNTVLPPGSNFGSYCTLHKTTDIIEDDVMLWPENRLGSFKFNGTFTKLIGMSTQGGTFIEYLDRITADAVLSFNNISISFTSTTVKPKIINCVPFYDVIKFEAMSTSNPGSCYAEVTPLGITSSQSILLTNEYNSFALDIITDSYVGNVVLNIRCYRYSTSCSASLNYITNSTFNSNDNMLNVIGINLNPINAISNLGHVLDWITEFIPWTYIGISFWIIFTIIIGLLVIYVLKRISSMYMFKKHRRLRSF